MPLAPRRRCLSLESPAPSLKGVLDRTVAAVLLLCTAPWLALVALAVWSTDDGPLLDREPRVGQWGRRFDLLRLRTVPPAGRDRSHVRDLVRRTHLDELLQLVNVLRGDMALIGPLAPTPAEWSRRTTDVRSRLRPGVVGLRPLAGGQADGDEVTVTEWYVREWTPVLDLRILVRALLRSGG